MQEESTASARFVLDSLQHTVGQLANTAVVERRREEEYDSPSSGVGSLKAELEEEISSSLQLARRHGEERLMVERERWREEMAGVERERDMERRNSALRYQQLQEEKDQLKQEVERLQEKVRLIHLEKEQLDEQVAELIEEQRCRSPVTAVSTLVAVALTREVGTMAEASVFSREVSTTMAEAITSTLEEERSNREEELLQTVQALSMRVEVQDDQLAQVKEDNIVLRSQVRSLRETVGAKISPRPKGKEGKFRLFGMLGTGRGDPDEQGGPEEKYEDPADLRKMLAEVRAELVDQKEVNM
jgi:cell division protein FtsB